MNKVINNIFILVLIIIPFNAYSDQASAARNLTKEQILQYLPEDVNKGIVRNGGKIFIEPATYMVNVTSNKNNLEYTYEHPIKELARMVATISNVSVNEAQELLKTNKFKRDWISKTLEKKIIFSNCNTPLYKVILNKGITIIYHYQYNNGDKIGSVSVDESMCK